MVDLQWGLFEVWFVLGTGDMVWRTVGQWSPLGINGNVAASGDSRFKPTDFKMVFKSDIVVKHILAVC